MIENCELSENCGKTFTNRYIHNYVITWLVNLVNHSYKNCISFGSLQIEQIYLLYYLFMCKT